MRRWNGSARHRLAVAVPALLLAGCADGSDPGAAAALRDAFLVLMKERGTIYAPTLLVGRNCLLVMATRNGARALRRPDLGTLEKGQVADILVLSEDPRKGVAAYRALDDVIHGSVWTGREE